MLLLSNAPGYKDAEVTNGLMNGVDDRLAAGANLLNVLVEIENPSESLLGRILRKSIEVPSDV